MRNRLFAVICVLLALAMLPGGASAKAKKAPKKDIGIQLYSVRSLIGVFGKSQGDYKPVLKQLADMGYTSVEAASYKDGMLYGQTPEQFRKDVEDAGMRVISTHCTLNLSDEELASGDFSKALAWWDECIAAHKAAGAEYIVVPSMRKISTLKDLQTYCRYFNEVGARCAAAGMKFGYHNHSREFEKIEDKVMLDYMLENTDPDKVLFEMDVYWTVMGKASPVDYFKKYPGRFRLLHIKDRREIGQSGMWASTPSSPTRGKPAWRTSSSRSKVRATTTSCAASANAPITCSKRLSSRLFSGTNNAFRQRCAYPAVPCGRPDISFCRFWLPPWFFR